MQNLSKMIKFKLLNMSKLIKFLRVNIRMGSDSVSYSYTSSYDPKGANYLPPDTVTAVINSAKCIVQMQR
jgi:hypothetical protein